MDKETYKKMSEKFVNFTNDCKELGIQPFGFCSYTQYFIAYLAFEFAPSKKEGAEHLIDVINQSLEILEVKNANNDKSR